MLVVDQECENLICTHLGENATCVQEGAAAAQVQVKLTCEQCLTKFLSSTQITGLFNFADVTTFDELCARISGGSEAGFRGLLVSFGVPEPVALQLIQCLKDAGLVFGT